jgi:hypothetical protein
VIINKLIPTITHNSPIVCNNTLDEYVDGFNIPHITNGAANE